MSIQEHLNKIRNAIYGREVRESIAKGIETAYDDASEKDNANMEVKIARGTHPNLRSRLEEVDNKQQQNTTQLAQKADKSQIGAPTQTQVDAWLSANPQATTTVQDGAVGFRKMDTQLKGVIGDVLYGKSLYKTTLSEPIEPGSIGRGWANTILYNGEPITAVKTYIGLDTNPTNVTISIRNSNDINTILTASETFSADEDGYYIFTLEEEITPWLVVEDRFIIAIESKDNTSIISTASDRGTAPNTNVDTSGHYQKGGAAWANVSVSNQHLLHFEMLTSVDISKKVDNDSDYQKIKNSVEGLQAANELFSTHTEPPIPSNGAPSVGWGTKIKYEGEKITSAKIFVNIASSNVDVKATIRIGSDISKIIAESRVVSAVEKGLYTFVFDREVNPITLDEDYFFITLETVANTASIYGASSDTSAPVSTRVDLEWNKQKSANGSFVDVNSSKTFPLYVIFANSDVQDAIEKKQDKAKKQFIETIDLADNFYTVANDVDYTSEAERHYPLPIYNEYLANEYHTLEFENGRDRYYLLEEIIDNEDVRIKPHIAKFSDGDFTTNEKSFNQVITNASVPNKKSFVLTIGDSVTQDGQEKGRQYWKVANELFELESIDFERENNVTFVGTSQKRNPTEIDYKGVVKTVYSSAEGRGGWDAQSYMRYSTVLSKGQETWDILGLGDGSGTDYVETPEQLELIRITNEDNDRANPPNPFFDNDKQGNMKFSIAKWLERYRTLDDEGNRLSLGSGTGTLITDVNLDKIDVCTPTHIVLATGHNDIVDQGVDGFVTNIIEWISEIRTQLPNVYIIVSLSIPRIGLWEKKRYPNYVGTGNPNMLAENIQFVNKLLAYFDGYDEVTNRTILLPTYFVTPSAEGYRVIEHEDVFGNKVFNRIGDTLHPNTKAHVNWGYQLYSLLKYTMTL